MVNYTLFTLYNGGGCLGQRDSQAQKTKHICGKRYTMSTQLTLNPSERALLTEQFRKCLVFTFEDEESDAQFRREFEDALSKFNITSQGAFTLSQPMNVIFSELQPLFESAVDLICLHGIDARLQALRHLPSFVLEHFMDIAEHGVLNQNIDFDKDPLVYTLLYDDPSTNLYKSFIGFEESRILNLLRTLIVDCSEPFSPHFGEDALGTYSPSTNTLHLFTLNFFNSSVVDLPANNPNLRYLTIKFMMKLYAHTSLHEFAHMLEQCWAERGISGSIKKSLHNSWYLLDSLATYLEGKNETRLREALNQGVTFGSIQDLRKFLGNSFSVNAFVENLENMIGHCSRFKYALLYLVSRQESLFKMSASVIQAAYTNIQNNVEFEKHVGEDMLYVPFHLGEGDNPYLQAYGWEDALVDYEKVNVDNIAFGSSVEKTTNVIEDLLSRQKSIRSNYAKASRNLNLVRDEVVYAYRGEPNLLALDYSGDAFALILNVLLGGEPRKLSETPFKPQAQLYLIRSERGFEFVYSAEGKHLSYVTLEDAWWLLTL